MRNFKTVLFALTAIGVLFAACKKDDENDPPKNQMTYNGAEYELSQGIIENYGSWESSEGYNFDVTLLTSGIAIYVVNDMIDSLSGIGSGVVFELFSSDSTHLADGIYILDEDGNGTPGTFTYGSVAIDYNVGTQEGTEKDFIEGTCEVNRNGETFQLSFDCKTEDNIAITGYYNGVLQAFDYSDYKKSTWKNLIW
jgi:hypothetical protein